MAKLSYRMLQIGGAPAGLLGLDESLTTYLQRVVTLVYRRRKNVSSKRSASIISLPNRPVKNIKVF